METRSIRHAVLAGVAAAGMLVGAAFAAEPNGELAVPELRVAYGDLDLAKPAGVQALHRRLEVAAERVCPRTDGRVKVEQRAAARECRKQALERAVRAIGSPELAALHAATTARG
jgi:UrcA family protein